MYVSLNLKFPVGTRAYLIEPAGDEDYGVTVTPGSITRVVVQYGDTDTPEVRYVFVADGRKGGLLYPDTALVKESAGAYEFAEAIRDAIDAQRPKPPPVVGPPPAIETTTTPVEF